MTNRCLAALATILVLAAPATSAELEGVILPDRVEVRGTALVLNGLGLAARAAGSSGIVKVYVGGLYLPAKEASVQKILAADAPRHLVISYLRAVSKNRLCDGWNDGLEVNTPDASAAVRSQFQELCGWMEDVDSGDTLAFTYVPGKGTEVRLEGRPTRTFRGKPFADALLACWIGPDPGPGEAFKSDLLGGG